MLNSLNLPDPLRFILSDADRKEVRMRYLKYFALLAILLFTAVGQASAQVSVGIGVGPVGVGIGAAPVCAYGYYGYYPYACAPYGYYGPAYFSGGIFIGAGPWFHGGYYGRPGYGGGYGWHGGNGWHGNGYVGHGSVAGGYRGGTSHVAV